MDETDVDHYLGIIEERTLTGQNGAAWQIATWRQLLDEQELDRPEAARELVRRYQKLSFDSHPVHTWPLGG